MRKMLPFFSTILLFGWQGVAADLRDGVGEPLLLTGPVYDDLHNATKGAPNIVNH